MAAFTTTGGLDATCGFPPAVITAGVARRRRISPQAGHALEILGHAIEYLSDEFVHEGAQICPQDGRLEAVQLLMGINRQIYFACPEAPSMGARWRSLLGLRAA